MGYSGSARVPRILSASLSLLSLTKLVRSRIIALEWTTGRWNSISLSPIGTRAGLPMLGGELSSLFAAMPKATGVEFEMVECSIIIGRSSVLSLDFGENGMLKI